VPTRGNRSLSTRAPEEIHERVKRAAARAGVAKATWLLEAVTWALETDEGATRRAMPKAVAAALPRRVNGRLVMPRGRMFEAR
jgi:hypothetical protein